MVLRIRYARVTRCSSSAVAVKHLIEFYFAHLYIVVCVSAFLFGSGFVVRGPKLHVRAPTTSKLIRYCHPGLVVMDIQVLDVFSFVCINTGFYPSRRSIC